MSALRGTPLALIEPYIEVVGDKHRAFVQSTRNPAAYGESLFHTIRYVRETVPTLLRVADSRPDHPSSNWLRVHAAEEEGHDKVFERDLRSIGCGLEFSLSPPVEEFIQLERSICDHEDPVSAVFGDMVVAECFPPTKERAVLLAEHFGLSKASASGAILHSVVDQDHRRDVVRWIESGTLNNQKVIERALLVCRLFCRHWQLLKDRYAS